MLESVRYEFVNSGVSVSQILQLWSEKEPRGGKFVSANRLIGRKESAPPSRYLDSAPDSIHDCREHCVLLRLGGFLRPSEPRERTAEGGIRHPTPSQTRFLLKL